MSSKIKEFIFGLILISSGFILWILRIHPLAMGLFVSGVVFLISRAVYLRKPLTDRIIDERVVRINEKAGYYAFWILISSLAMATTSSWYFELKPTYTLEALGLIGLYSFFILRYYFSKANV